MKTHYADDDTLKYIGKLEAENARLRRQELIRLEADNARLRAAIMDYENDCGCLPEDQSVTETVEALRAAITEAIRMCDGQGAHIGYSYRNIADRLRAATEGEEK